MADRRFDASKIEIRHLRYFLAVAEELNFSRAAERLGIAQPPLSQQIFRLEELVGQRLFERRPQVRLTSAGKSLADSAQRLIAQLQHDVDEARRAGLGQAGTLTVGFPASALVTWFPQAIRSFREKYPEVNLRLRELPSADQVAALDEGVIDIGLLRGKVVEDRLHCSVILEEPFVAVVSGNHPFHGRRSVGLQELAQEDFVLFPRGVAPALRDEISAIFREAGVEPRTVMEAQEWLTIIGLVETGIGVSIAPSSFQRLRWGEVEYLELANVSATTSISACTSRKGGSPAAANFLEELRAQGRG
jgi:DNA-binding transcriptional LysR family regulator